MKEEMFKICVRIKPSSEYSGEDFAPLTNKDRHKINACVSELKKLGFCYDGDIMWRETDSEQTATNICKEVKEKIIDKFYPDYNYEEGIILNKTVNEETLYKNIKFK